MGTTFDSNKNFTFCLGVGEVKLFNANAQN
jgi:hypothetical protein